MRMRPPKLGRITSSACWRKCSRGQDFATLAVSGGSTPKLMFQKLAATRFPWDKVHIFWVDERCVPPNDAASNYKLADDFLIHPAHIPERNVHRVLGELTPETAAKRYADEIREFFGLGGRARCRASMSCIAGWVRTRTPRACFPASR